MARRHAAGAAVRTAKDLSGPDPRGGIGLHRPVGAGGGPARALAGLAALMLLGSCSGTPLQLPPWPGSSPPARGPPVTPPPLEPAGGSYETTARVNLRVGPGTDYRILTTLDAGTPVRVLGRVRGRDWYRVEAAGKQGYVAGRYIASSPVGGGEDVLPRQP